MKIFSLSPNGNGKGTGRMADSATQFCIHKYIVGAVSPPWRGGARVTGADTQALDGGGR